MTIIPDNGEPTEGDGPTNAVLRRMLYNEVGVVMSLSVGTMMKQMIADLSGRAGVGAGGRRARHNLRHRCRGGADKDDDADDSDDDGNGVDSPKSSAESGSNADDDNEGRQELRSEAE